MVPLGSSSFRDMFSELSLCASTQPGISTMGVPITSVAGGYIGTARGGSFNH